MKQYEVVRVKSICSERFANRHPDFQRHPMVGDVGTILEVYTNAYEVECSDPNKGITIWLEAMYPEELQTL